MPIIGAYEAKTKLAKLLECVSRGERFVITKHGMPIAVLGPAPTERKENPKKIIEAIKELRKGHSLGDISVRELIEEGRH